MKYGIEIEFVANSEQVGEVLAGMRDRGMNTEREGYNHNTRRHWKIVTDATCGYELVSPILDGEDGLNEIKLACEALQAARVKVNKNCGLHVHHDARHLTTDTIKNVAIAYKRYEKIIDGFMPQSRRSRNRWIKGLRGLSMERIENATSVYELQRAFRHDRYYKLNLQAYNRHGTIEFRQHSGSIEAEKIVNWVKLTYAIVQRAEQGPVRVGRATLQNFFSNMLSAAAPRMSAAVSRPTKGVTKQVWDIADSIANSGNHHGNLRHAVITSCQFEGINQATAATQYAKWNKARTQAAQAVEVPRTNNALVDFYTARTAHFAR